MRNQLKLIQSNKNWISMGFLLNLYPYFSNIGSKQIQLLRC